MDSNAYITKKTQKGLNDFLHMCKNIDEDEKIKIEKKRADVD